MKHKFLVEQTVNAALTFAPLAGVAGEEGIEVQLWLLWLALELERVGEAVREEGFDLRPLDRNGAIPWEAPSGRMNFSRSSRFVLPRAGKKRAKNPLKKKSQRFLNCRWINTKAKQSHDASVTLCRHAWGTLDVLCFLFPTPTDLRTLLSPLSSQLIKILSPLLFLIITTAL